MATYYVDPVNGSNSNDGLSRGNAVATTAYAVSLAVSYDTILLCNTGPETVSAAVTLSTNLNFIGCNAAGTEDNITKYVYNCPSNDNLFVLTFANNGVAPYTFKNLNIKPNATLPKEPFRQTVGTISNFYYIEYNSTKSFNTDGGTSTSFIWSIYESKFSNCTDTVLFYGASNRSVPRLFNCIISTENRYLCGNGNGDITLSNCVLNNTTLNGSFYSRYTILNSILLNSALRLNDRASYGPACLVLNSVIMNVNYAFIWETASTSIVDVHNSLFFNVKNITYNAPANFSLPANNIIEKDPLFRDIANNDFSYPNNSPLVGRGGLPI